MKLLEPKNVLESSLLEPRSTYLLEWTYEHSLVRIDEESSWALLDNGSTINAVTPGFIEACSLDVSPLSDLVNDMLGIYGFGGLFS